MASKRNGVVIGIVAVAVIGVVAITFYSQRGRVADEDAAGAIGAAERYRAQQISDEDVILDIPGQEELAAAVFEVLTDEQKAELMGRIDEAARRDAVARFAPGGAGLEGLTARQVKGFTVALDQEARAEIAAAMRIEAGDFANMRAEMVARKFGDLDAKTRAGAFDRFEASEEAFGRWDAERTAGFVGALDREAQADLAAAMRIEAGDFANMRAETVARKFGGLDAKTRQGAFGRFEASEEALGRWDAKRTAAFLGALDRAEQERIAAAMRIEASDFANMRAEMVARKFGGLDAKTRAGAFDRFEANEEAFGRWSDRQTASFMRAINRADQERIAAAMRVEAGDFAQMRATMVAEKISALDARTREGAFGRFVADDAAFARRNVAQRAAFTDALGARACERAILQARSFNNLRQEQQLAVWANLGLNGQVAALRYAGLSADDLARVTSMDRRLELDRVMNERRAAQGAATR